MKRIARIAVEFLMLVGALGVIAVAQNQPAADSQSGDSLAEYARTIRKDSGAKVKPKVFDNDNLPVNDKLSIVGSSQPTPPAEESPAAKAEEPTNATASTPAAEGSKTSQEEKPAAKTEATPNDKPETSSGASTGETQPADAKTSDTQAAGSNPAEPAETKPADSRTAGTTTIAPKSAESKPPAGDEAAKQAQWKQWGEKINSQKDQIDLATRELDVLQREYQIRAAAMYGDAGSRLRNSADWDKQDAQYKQQIADKQKTVDDAKQRLEDMQEDARKAGIPASIREP